MHSTSTRQYLVDTGPLLPGSIPTARLQAPVIVPPAFNPILFANPLFACTITSFEEETKSLVE